MQHWLEKTLAWFLANVPQDAELRRRATLTLVVVALLAVVSSVIAIAEVLIRGATDPRSLITIAVAAYSISALTIFRVTGSVQGTAISFLIILQSACTFSFFVSEVSATAALVWHFVLPPAGMFLLGTRGGSLLTAASLASLITAQAIVPMYQGLSPDPLLLVVTWTAMFVVASFAFFFEKSRDGSAKLASRRQKETEDALAHAEQASRHKSEFLAKMSHEIRTPMNAILMSQHLLLNEQLTTKQEELLRLALQSGDSLLTILDDILDVSRVEAGQLSLDARPFSPRAVVTSVEQLLRPVAEAKNQDLTLDFDTNLPEWVLGDPVRVRQIIVNLVNNAIKFTPTEGRVTVRAFSAGDGIVAFDVEDTGPGIAEELLPSLFKPFVRGGGPTQGTGLGLTVTKGLVSAMKGTLTVASPGGSGTCFAVRLPLDHHAGPQRNRPPSGFEIPAPLRQERTRPLILLAEDNPINQALTTRMLELQGYRVVGVSDGEGASSRVKQGDVDLVLMDCSMPVVDGFEATRRIRNLRSMTSNLPIIAMTANAMAGERERCLAAGMNDYLAKPVAPKELFDIIERWLNARDGVPQKGFFEPDGVAQPVVPLKT